jgi:hypothetical protein
MQEHKHSIRSSWVFCREAYRWSNSCVCIEYHPIRCWSCNNNKQSPISNTMIISQINPLPDGNKVLQFVCSKYATSPGKKLFINEWKVSLIRLTKVWDQTSVDVYNLKNSIDAIKQKESQNLSNVAQFEQHSCHRFTTIQLLTKSFMEILSLREVMMWITSIL